MYCAGKAQRRRRFRTHGGRANFQGRSARSYARRGSELTRHPRPLESGVAATLCHRSTKWGRRARFFYVLRRQSAAATALSHSRRASEIAANTITVAPPFPAFPEDPNRALCSFPFLPLIIQLRSSGNFFHALHRFAQKQTHCPTTRQPPPNPRTQSPQKPRKTGLRRLVCPLLLIAPCRRRTQSKVERVPGPPPRSSWLGQRVPPASYLHASGFQPDVLLTRKCYLAACASSRQFLFFTPPPTTPR